MKKSPQSTSLRSVTHTTDSTRSGWTAKSSAAQAAPTDRAGSVAAAPAARSRRRPMKKKRVAVAACRSRLRR